MAVAAATVAPHAKLFLSCTMCTFLSFVLDFYYLFDTLDTPCARARTCVRVRTDASTDEFPAVVRPNIMNK